MGSSRFVFVQVLLALAAGVFPRASARGEHALDSVRARAEQPSTNVAAVATTDNLPQWQKEIAARVRILSRDVDTFHWTDLRKIDGLVTDHSAPLNIKGAEYARKFTAFFRRPLHESVTDQDFPGFYLAADPVASRNFGGAGEDWAVLKVPLEVGQKFLDLRSIDDQDAFSAAARAELHALGCDAGTISGMQASIDPQGPPGDLPRCRTLFAQACEKLGVGFYTYSFITAQLPGFPQRPWTAFVLVSPRAVDWSHFRAFSSEIPHEDPDAKDRVLIQETFRLAREILPEQERAELSFLAPWARLPHLPPEQFTRYARERYFGAGNHAEDKVAGSARALADEMAPLQDRARRIGDKLGRNIDPLRFRFLIRKFFSPDEADAPGVSIYWTPILSPAAEERAERHWRSAGARIESAARESARRGEPLTLEKIRTWYPELKWASPPPSSAMISQLDDRLAEDLSASAKRSMRNGQDRLERTSSLLWYFRQNYPFDKGFATVNRAIEEYLRQRWNLPPVFRMPWGPNLRYVEETVSAIRKISECLDRWDREDPARVQESECGIISPE